MWTAKERSSFFNTVKSCQLSCRVATRVHALIGCRKFGKQVQAPSLQRGELFTAREQRVSNDVEWIGKPAFRLLFGGISVEGLCVGQNSLPHSCDQSVWKQLCMIADDCNGGAKDDAGKCDGKSQAASAKRSLWLE